jgi:hypothetical protein
VRAVAVVLVALVALALAGGAAARDPREPQQRHTKADTALAKSMALVRSDLGPGWGRAPALKPAPPCTSEPDESKLVQTARIDPTFVWKDKVTEIGSEVDIFRTVADAKRDWQLSTLKVMQRCLFEALHRDLKDVKIHVQSAKQLPAPKLGERSLHYRLVFELRGKSRVLPVVVETIGFGVGNKSVVLHSLSPGGPVPPSVLTALDAKLAKRLTDALGGI